MNQPNQPQQINLKIDEKVGEGVYANLFVINHNPSEFVLDFGRILPGVPDAKIYSRVVCTPQHAKQLLQALEKNIENFENVFGEIRIQGQTADKGIGFKMDNPAETKH
jgi:hypothetical protein